MNREALAGFLGPLPGRSPAGPVLDRALSLAPWIRGAGFLPPGAAGTSPVPDPFAASPLPRLEELMGSEGLQAAAAWAASARFDDADRQAALIWLTDMIAVGAAPPEPTLLPPSFFDSELEGVGPEVRLWRPVAGRTHAPLFPALLWNRVVGDALELHAGPECGAAAVAVAEAFERPLAELLDALLAGSGVGALCRELLGPLAEAAGAHSPGVTAPASTAAAVGRLMRLPPDAMADAFRRADAVAPAHPYRAFAEGATVKLLYGGWGQLLGTAAALEREFPLAASPSPGDCFDADRARLAVRQIQPKKHPGSRAIQPALEALRCLPSEEPDSILVEIYPFAATVSGWAEPVRAPIAAQMHIPTAAALFRLRGSLKAPDFGDFDEPGVRELAARIRVVPREFGSPGIRVRRARVTVRNREGVSRAATTNAPWPPPAKAGIRARFHRFTEDLGLPDPSGLPLSAPVTRLFS